MAETAEPKSSPGPQDRLLLQELIADGRASHRELAKRTGMSLTTVNRRVRQMEDAGIIRGYTVDVDQEKVGWGLTVLIGLRIEKGYLETVQATIADDPRVFAVYDITGEWDGMVLARTRNRADLDDLAKTTMSGPHILRTNTVVALGTVTEKLTHLPAIEAGP